MMDQRQAEIIGRMIEKHGPRVENYNAHPVTGAVTIQIIGANGKRFSINSPAEWAQMKRQAEFAQSLGMPFLPF